MKRQLARPGLSYFDANSGRLITETAEVLDMKARIKTRWPELSIAYDSVDKVYVVVQKCEDGVERLALQRPYCDERLMTDLAKADPTSSYFIDPEKAVDDHNASIEKDRDRELEDLAGDFGERFLHALKKDGFMNHEEITGVKSKRSQNMARRAINVGQRT